ncbi:MAG TPA: PQQ-dependent sugar dehydrogenase [Sphingobacteriaceae bacterium]|nr:PQQ-dependent sugar dehydrogenase [Sphingobacteriaceae bacterium]
MKTFNIIFILLLFNCAFSGCKKKLNSVANNPSVNDAELATNVITDKLSLPWEIIWGPDNMLWITEKGGRVSRVNPADGQISSVITISDVKSMGEGGLLGMVLHPDFNITPQVFVVYNYDKSGSYTEKVVRYNYTGGTLINPVVIIDNIPAANIHNGSRLLISADKKLFITTGDAANPASAQNNSSLSGKILRINLDGSIPSDNPVSTSPVWSNGHRNAQGLVFAKGRLYSSEHGPSADDEVNIIEKGRNYGWPTVMGACDQSNEISFCSTNNVAVPIYTWTPTLAVCGMDYYNSDLIPQWKNSLIMTTLKDNTLYQLKLNETGDKVETVATYFKGNFGRLRDVCISPDGKVYMITSNGSGDKIVAITRKN